MKTVNIGLRSAENILMERTSILSLTQDLLAPLSDEYTKSIIVSDHLFLIDRSKLEEKFICISLAKDGPISGLDQERRNEALWRILRTGVIELTQSGALPVNWRPYHFGKFISIQSNARATGETARIFIDTKPPKSGLVFVFGLDRSKEKLENVLPDYSYFDEATELLSILEAADEQPRIDVAEFHDALRLSNPLLDRENSTLTYQEWIDQRLTKEQSAFIEQPLTQSIRLIGPPGSGKTIALTVKVLKELADAKSNGKSIRLLVITHALATAELIESLLSTMDPLGEYIHDESGNVHFDVATIHSIANKHMHYDLEHFRPLSLDGVEGRNLQFELINSLINEFITTDWIAYKLDCSNDFVRSMEESESTPSRRVFIWELINEFGCVLDAEGGRPTGERRKRYLEESRKGWMMSLAQGAEREVVLEIYNRFREQLKAMQTITGDQMIADYLNWLDMHRWDALRDTSGYDAIFVDELHMFNRQERMVFRKLLRDDESPPVVVMAYDPKQSPRDTFVGLGGNKNSGYFWADAKLGRTEKYELNDIFRYTPQIANALSLIGQCFPGLDLDDEWPEYLGVSKIEDGPKPIISEYKTTKDLYPAIFRKAKDLQRKFGNKKKVAILCASINLFGKYAEAGEYKNDFVLISSRDELPRAKDSSNKFIFSAPEYVAGLQFDTVFLIEANDDEVPDCGSYRASAERKYVSVIYLGASRAERRLEIFATKEHGGISRLFNLAIAEGAIEKVGI